MSDDFEGDYVAPKPRTALKVGGGAAAGAMAALLACLGLDMDIGGSQPAPQPVVEQVAVDTTPSTTTSTTVAPAPPTTTVAPPATTVPPVVVNVEVLAPAETPVEVRAVPAGTPTAKSITENIVTYHGAGFEVSGFVVIEDDQFESLLDWDAGPMLYRPSKGSTRGCQQVDRLLGSGVRLAHDLAERGVDIPESKLLGVDVELSLDRGPSSIGIGCASDSNHPFVLAADYDALSK